MRPVTLAIQGFGTFREPVELNFAGVDYFALVGPTGSGKSTIIDAICFALYGSVPRHDRRVVAPLVSTGAIEARVELVFDARGHRYRVVRVARAKDGKASVKEARLETVSADGVESLAGSVKELNEQIAHHVVGLSYEEFCKCVVLPQGDFAAFLHDEPSKRQDLLVRLLGLGRYSRMASLASARAAAADADIRIAQAALDTLAGATPDALADARRHAEALDVLSVSARELVPIDSAARAEVARLADEVRGIDRLIFALGAVQVPEEFAVLGNQLDARRAELDAAESKAREATQRSELLQTPPLPDPAACERVLAAHASLAEAVAQRDLVAAQRAEAETAEQAAEAHAALAHTALIDARRLCDSVQLTHSPHTLARALVVGEPCPVCEQIINELPRAKEVAELEAAQSALRTAEVANAAGEQTRRDTSNATAAVRGRLEAADHRVASITELVAEHPDVEAARRDLDSARLRASEIEAARQGERSAIRAAAEARAAHDAARSEVAARRFEFAAQRDPLVSAGLVPPGAHDDLHTAWPELVEWAATQHPEHSERRTELANQGRALRAEADTMVASFRNQAQAHAVSVGEEDDAAAIDRAVALATQSAAASAQQLQDDVLRADEHRTALADATECASVARTLAGLLRADGFERWLLTTAMDDLVAAASVTLRSLSGGAYSLAHDTGSGEFLVVDHLNADENRTARSLSGGETFQASLALALALSEHLARGASGAGAATLDAIFLDEGFGTLDPESLETVAATVEQLASGDRMVGIITHVRELAERVPVRFEVRKIGRTSHVEVASDS